MGNYIYNSESSASTLPDTEAKVTTHEKSESDTETSSKNDSYSNKGRRWRHISSTPKSDSSSSESLASTSTAASSTPKRRKQLSAEERKRIGRLKRCVRQIAKEKLQPPSKLLFPYPHVCKILERAEIDESSSSSESDCDTNSDRLLTLMKFFNLKFNGDVSDARDFLQRMDNFRACNLATDREVLAVLPGVLSGLALRWFRKQKSPMQTWAVFKKEFMQEFLDEFNYWYEYDYLHQRRQGDRENIKSFIIGFSHMANGVYRQPPSEEIQVKIAIQNLQPQYRRALYGKVVSSLDDIKKYCLEFEAIQQLLRERLPVSIRIVRRA